MRGPFRPLFACLLAALLAMLLTGVAYAQTQGPVVVGPGESIQRAVDAAKRGDTIVVRGTHREAVVIRKDGISLAGDNAVLKPPDRPTSPSCFAPAGFCVRGNVNLQTGDVSDYAQDVTITGFTVRNFEGFGIVALGARDATFARNRTFNNAEYGITSFTSTGTRVLFNVTGRSGEAGIYIGDSPRANARVVGNETYGNLFGIFVRNALGGSIGANSVHNNCMGMMFLADAPGPAGEFAVRANSVRKNTRLCPAGEEAPPISGVGIGLLGARGMDIQANNIFDNVPSGPTAFRGGVVVVRGLEGTAPENNVVRGNEILRNRPDIFWDKSGSGNRLRGNVCKTSRPGGLC